MIAFDTVSAAEMEAMCTPMHRVLSPVSLARSSKLPSTSKSADMGGATQATGALYLGSMAAMHDGDLLRTHDIAHLVQVLEVPWIPQPDANAGIKCYRIDIEDRSSAALQPHLEEACNYIRTSLGRGDNVLVHCQQGVSRSASIVIAYLIRERSMTFDDAFDLVKRRRQCIKPNSGFVQALRDWENTCKRSRPASR